MQLTKSYQLISNISTTYGGIRTYAKYTSQSSTDNTTTYSLQQRYYVNSSYTKVSFDSATSVLDGKSKKYTSYTTMNQGETTIQTVNRTITHNADGSSPTKSVSSSWTATFGGGGSATASITFPNITRMSLPTLNQPTTNDPLFEIGNTVRLYTNRPVATYTHTLYININGTPTLIASDIGEYTDIDTSLIANQLYQAYPSTARITGTFTLYTYNGATLVGSANCDYLTYVREGATFSVAYKDTNGTTTTITGNNQKIIQNKSTLQFNITNASVQHYASGLASVDITINGETNTYTISGTSGVSKDINWGVVNLSQNTTATITLYDSRGIGTTQTINLTMLSWQLPTADITLQRQQNFYTQTDITVNANYSSLDGNNTITIKYYLKRDDAADYGTGTTISDGTPTTFVADNTHAWDVKIELTDRLGTNTYYRQVGVGIPIMFIDRNKHSVGVNCFPTGNNTLEVDGVNVLNTMMVENKVFDFKVLNITVDRNNPFPDIVNGIGTLTKTTGFINYSYNSGEHVMIGYLYANKSYGALICMSYNNNFYRVYTLNNGSYSSNSLFTKARYIWNGYISSVQSSTTAVEVANFSKTLTTYGGDIFVSVSVPFYQSGGTGNMRLYMDGVEQAEIIRTSSTSKVQVHGEAIITNVSPGSHTFKVTMQPQNNTYTCYIGTYVEKVFTIIEL